MVFLKKYKPTTPGIRGCVSVIDNRLSKESSFKRLTVKIGKSSGRNNCGRITVWHRGGGHKRNYRLIDWKRDKFGVFAKVEKIEYDPNRTSHIALLLYTDGERRYILAPEGLNIGDTIQSGFDLPTTVGNCVPLKSVPVGVYVHCVELYPGAGAIFCRSAGSSAQVLAFDDRYTTLRLESGEIRKVLSCCRATIGFVGNKKHMLRKLGKAGRSRWKNKRPVVRGVAMNPIDHPHGGGEGKTSSGRHPCSPWGKVEGKKTVRKKLSGTSLLILKRRK